MASWTPTDYILADLFDLTYAAAGGKGKDYPRPAELIQRRKDREHRNRLLAEQAERNRVRDASA